METVGVTGSNISKWLCMEKQPPKVLILFLLQKASVSDTETQMGGIRILCANKEKIVKVNGELYLP